MEPKQKSKTSAFSLRSFQLICKNKTRLHTYLNRGIVAGICLVSLAYIVSINDLSIKGFILQDIKKDIALLESENERYEVSAMTLTSYQLIDEKAKRLGMIKVDNIEYVSLVDGAVAKK
jgi:cell division protein FtsL